LKRSDGEEVITQRLKARGWQHGCLIGNLSLESTDHSQIIRRRLAEIFAEWREPFARCLRQAAADGRITLSVPALDLADFLLASWQGAILRMKVERSPEPLERFKDVVFTAVLR
jgi:TetR/AcrR family transcriptional repressor of nem operon